MTKPQRYVVTREIRAAVQARETEVLDGLNISWRDGRPHIRCPYPDHADEHASWRWDEQSARAHCACSAANSIFDVVMKVEGIDFEAAIRRTGQGVGH